ncbi:MAG TPA: hypothetical protein VGX97_08315 [bacterium]|nr:hypothetical protein [bacterium]
MPADRTATAHVDERYLVDVMSRLARVPTDVPLGFNTLIEPDDPFSGKIANAPAYGCPEPAVFGQGVSRAKAHQAVMLAVLKMLVQSGARFEGTLYWAVNNEGCSSHECSEAILAALDPKPVFGVVQIGTGPKLSLGNRGRVDINVHVQGRAAHSSARSKSSARSTGRSR